MDGWILCVYRTCSLLFCHCCLVQDFFLFGTTLWLHMLVLNWIMKITLFSYWSLVCMGCLWHAGLQYSSSSCRQYHSSAGGEPMEAIFPREGCEWTWLLQQVHNCPCAGCKNSKFFVVVVLLFCSIQWWKKAFRHPKYYYNIIII